MSERFRDVLGGLARQVHRFGIGRESAYAAQPRTPTTWSERNPFRPAGGVDLAEMVALAEREALERAALSRRNRARVYFEFNDAELMFDSADQRFRALRWMRESGMGESLSFYEESANTIYRQLQEERHRGSSR